MKPLPTEINHEGYLLKQVERRGDWAIYSQSNERGRVISFELIKIRVEKEKVWADGHVTVAHERYAKPSEWGTSAWTLVDLNRAREKLLEVTVKGSEGAPGGQESQSA